ncbi:DUF1828 domain-containing protein [Burkholderia pseudomultivorans]|uniref:DUF1828 domain-containing protein n=1 Tax=Burkholderia pseudomultivorans TaxID=1207504 RepID=A0ABU2DXW8_9BURK|nr:DUF1828 domain-containing protein [Burkholderia pseudomultivorans]MDR8728809.1 hypothetical protein [Burkholderia pseudomultivorans]MDR8733877.1 hypothetical protein [Burkholderia pseudomultivorans]MDR8742955.1 hypothetical protein [Burkholderia pseudomultivorans]MDR8752371.1 hypothetical protein [Burkholderia pseudomultivorans]MDR8778351.1 hypothetical protein [Burkholderia pseudomultivorans]
MCESWCSELDVVEDGDTLRLSMPLTEVDGDYVTVWVRSTLGGWRLEDAGSTLMRMSYDSDISTLLKGPRRVLLDRLLVEYGARLEDSGQVVSESSEADLGHALLRYSQALLRANELKSWTRTRVASTFFEDLRTNLVEIVGAERVVQNYSVPGVPSADDYRVDFSIAGAAEPLFVFGIPSKDRARLATIVLQHLQQHLDRFNSIVVFQNAAEIGTGDLRRLMNAANDMVDSIDARDALERKIRHRLVA